MLGNYIPRGKQRAVAVAHHLMLSPVDNYRLLVNTARLMGQAVERVANLRQESLALSNEVQEGGRPARTLVRNKNFLNFNIESNVKLSIQMPEGDYDAEVIYFRMVAKVCFQIFFLSK